jgi:DNA-binding response OmpR family regulator
MSEKILLVEDEPKVAAFIKKGLEENDFAVDVSHDGLEGKNMALSKQYGIVVLDVNLPSMSGFEISREIRAAKKQMPILMLTALGTTDDKVSGFESGADDYLVKPFEFRELLMRIRALAKRAQMHPDQENVVTVGDLSISFLNKNVTRASRLIELTAKEFSLLHFLAVNKGRVVSRQEIAEHVWDVNFDTGTNVIDVYVNFLRKKIDRDFPVKLIHTYVGMGYVMKEPEVNEPAK